MKQNNRGFSLVELIVVIAIMAILVGVAVPVYTAYITKAEEAKDAQYLAALSHTAQLFAAENGLELSSVWVAPEVLDDKGVELVLEDGKVFDGEMDAFYAMLGGAYTFETIEKTHKIVYREDIVNDTTEDKTETSCSTHNVKVIEPATCQKDGYLGCDNCDYYERIPASGHEASKLVRVVGNLQVYKCSHDGCDFVTVVAQGNKIGD